MDFDHTVEPMDKPDTRTGESEEFDPNFDYKQMIDALWLDVGGEG